MLANRSHVKYEFTNTKKLAIKLARIEASSICRQQFANLFADCFCAVHTHQLEFANTSFVNFSLPCEGRLRYEDRKARTGTAVDAGNFRGSRRVAKNKMLVYFRKGRRLQEFELPKRYS